MTIKLQIWVLPIMTFNFTSGIFIKHSPINPDFVSYIEGGKAVEENKYPWFGYLGSYYESQDHWNGAGSLIDKSWVLTAGHLANYYQNNLKRPIVVNFWVNNLSESHQESIEVDKIVYHPNYVDDVLTQRTTDLALLHLSRPVETIEPIKLQSNINYKLGTRSVLALGYPSASDANQQRKELKLTTLTENKAIAIYKQSIVQRNIYNPSTDFYTSTLIDGQNVGQGDSGGPILETIGEETVLLGVIKGGSTNLVDPSIPNTNVFVHKQINWINQEIAKLVEKIDEQKIIKNYQNSLFSEIFNDENNPGNNIINPFFHKVSYQSSGSYSGPHFELLKYTFDFGYAYMINKYILHNDLFKTQIEEWISRSNYSYKLKMKILFTLVVGLLKVGIFDDLITPLFNYLLDNDFKKFMELFWKYFDINNHNEKTVIRWSLALKIESMNKTPKALWVNSKINFEKMEDWKTINYDGGLNFFIHFNSQNPRIFADVIYKTACMGCDDQKWQQINFAKRKVLVSNRMNGIKAWVDYIDNDQNITYVEEDE